VPVGPEQEDVALLQLDVVAGRLRVDALVVVVHRHGEDLLRAVLPHHVLVEDRLDLRGLRQRRAGLQRVFAVYLLRDDVVAQPDALVADVDRGPAMSFLTSFCDFAAEGALEISVSVVVPGHPVLTCR
jgi:hypothetical protein